MGFRKRLKLVKEKTDHFFTVFFNHNNEENEICLYIIITWSNIPVIKIKKVVTKDAMS